MESDHKSTSLTSEKNPKQLLHTTRSKLAADCNTNFRVLCPPSGMHDPNACKISSVCWPVPAAARAARQISRFGRDIGSETADHSRNRTVVTSVSRRVAVQQRLTMVLQARCGLQTQPINLSETIPGITIMSDCLCSHPWCRKCERNANHIRTLST